MKGFSFLFFAFILSFSAMAKSPPGLQHEPQQFEMKSMPDAVAFVAPSLEAIEADGQIFDLSGQIKEMPQTTFSTCIVAPSKAPALQPGNNRYSCYPSDAKVINYCANATTTTAKEPTKSSKADFKVGWQGNLKTI